MNALQYVGMNRTQLATVVSDVGFKRAMIIRREMQEVLARGAQKGVKADRLPMFMQNDLIERISWIEKWCRHYFMYHRMKDLRNTDATKSHVERKSIARLEWESEIIPRESY